MAIGLYFFKLFQLLTAKDIKKMKLTLKIDTSDSTTNNLTVIKTEPHDTVMIDSSSSDSLLTPNHLLKVQKIHVSIMIDFYRPSTIIIRSLKSKRNQSNLLLKRTCTDAYSMPSTNISIMEMTLSQMIWMTAKRFTFLNPNQIVHFINKGRISALRKTTSDSSSNLKTQTYSIMNTILLIATVLTTTRHFLPLGLNSTQSSLNSRISFLLIQKLMQKELLMLLSCLLNCLLTRKNLKSSEQHCSIL